MCTTKENNHSDPRSEYMVSTTADDSDVTCRALLVALRAAQILIAWHSGVISADAAMAALEQEIHQTGSRSRITDYSERLSLPLAGSP